jgi:hypothetical protein
MDALLSQSPLGGVLDRTMLANMLAELGQRLPEVHVRWDGVSMPITRASVLADHSPSETQVVALLLLDEQRPALCLSTQPMATWRGAA